MANNASGEFFDLTITSYNNAFGKKKIEGAFLSHYCTINVGCDVHSADTCGNRSNSAHGRSQETSCGINVQECPQ